MLIIEPKEWPGQLVPYWMVKDDGDNWPDAADDWNEQHVTEDN